MYNPLKKLTYDYELNRQHEVAKLELLAAQTQQEYYTHMVNYLRDKITRLDSLKQQEKK